MTPTPTPTSTSTPHPIILMGRGPHPTTPSTTGNYMTPTPTPTPAPSNCSPQAMLDMAQSITPSYTVGQIEFIRWMQNNRTAFTVYDSCTIERANIVDVLETSGSVYVAVPAWIAVEPKRKAHRGAYYVPEIHLDIALLKVNTNTRGRKAGSPNVKGCTPTVDPHAPYGCAADSSRSSSARPWTL